MSVNGEDFINVARIFLDLGPEEINHRNSVSRSYYAAYHLAQRAVDLCPDNSHLAMGSHERLSERYLKHSSRNAKGIAYVLQAMKRYRTLADYQIDRSFDSTTALNLIEQYQSLSDKILDFESEFRSKSA